MIFIQNEFELQDFDKYQFRALLALLIRLPKTMPLYYSNHLYNRNTNHHQRMLILACFGYAAMELNGIKVEFEGSHVHNMLTVWSKKHQELERNHVTSFASIASNFFYPLVRGLVQWDSLDDSSTMHRFLCQVILTCGIILKCASKSPQIRKMAREYHSLLISFHSCPPFLYESVLQGLLFLFTCITPSLFKCEFSSKEIKEIAMWVMDMEKEIQMMNVRRILYELMDVIMKLVNTVEF